MIRIALAAVALLLIASSAQAFLLLSSTGAAPTCTPVGVSGTVAVTGTIVIKC